MNILFIHQNFPGQFRYLAQELQRRGGHRLLSIGSATAQELPGIRLLRYRPHRSPDQGTHHYLRGFEDGVLHGQAVMRLLLRLRQAGFTPDVVVAHPGWGETLFLKDVFPGCTLVHFCEYYYHSQGADSGFDPEFPLGIDGAARLRARNAMHLLNLENCDIGIAPTRWQHGLHPAVYQGRIEIIHEGIPAHALTPDPQAVLELADGTRLAAGQPVVTYVARNLEPYRGFHQFMRALPAILAGRADCQVLVVGGDEVSYGGRPADAPNWRTRMLAETGVDSPRVHFLGRVPYATYRRILQVSAVHVYLTYPFVLSWSLLEALASGCLVVASDTAPVREVVEQGVNGVLVDFFSPAAIAAAVLRGLDDPAGCAGLRQAARATGLRYDTAIGIDAYLRRLGIGEGPRRITA